MHQLLQVQQAQTLGPEAQVKEGIEEGVQAAVDVGQAGGVRVSQQQEAQEVAGDGKQVQVGEGISGLHEVKGDPAGGKHHHQRGDDLQQSLLTLVLFAQSVEVAGDGAADETVAHHHRQKREKEAKSCGGDAEPCNPHIFLLLGRHHEAKVHGTRRAVGFEVVLGGTEEKSRGSQQTGEQPDGYQRASNVATSAELGSGQGVDDGQVAVEAHAGEAEDAGVHVEEHHIAADLAQGCPKGPVVPHGCVNSPQRQGDHEGEVRQGQVADVDVSGSTLALGSPHSEYDHSISRQAQNENKHVKHRDDRV